MDNIQIATIVVFLVGLMALIKPIIDLNTNIAKLNSNIEFLTKKQNEVETNVKDVNTKLENHEGRIIKLETKAE